MSIKKRVIEQSTKLFVEQGIKSIRMDDIASHMGISKRTLYEIFGDKESLISECLRSHFERMDREFQEYTGGKDGSIALLVAVLENWDNWVDTNSVLIPGIKKFYPHLFIEIAESRNEEGLRKLRTMICGGIAEGVFLPEVNPDIAVSIFTSAMYGITMRDDVKCSGLPASEVSLTDAYKYIMIYFFRGISTDMGIRQIDAYLEKYKQKNN